MPSDSDQQMPEFEARQKAWTDHVRAGLWARSISPPESPTELLQLWWAVTNHERAEAEGTRSARAEQEARLMSRVAMGAMAAA